ncbi:MAG: DUF2794 domain-containing protein [Pseudomonadota bacterium]
MRPRHRAAQADHTASHSHDRSRPPPVTRFNRQELASLLDVYGRQVAAGEWRDYAIDMGADVATFSIFRRTSECALYRVEKVPKLARKQGAYRVVSASGLIVKRGHDLRLVLKAIDKPMRLVR